MKARKPTLKQGDVIEVYTYVSKRDIYGNRYNLGEVYLNGKKIGDWGKNWGGSSVGYQNAKIILEKTTNKPRGKRNFNYSGNDYRTAKIEYREIDKTNIPIREFKKYYGK